MEYLPRLIEEELDDTLAALGGVLVEGLMGCGKSRLCSQRAARVVNLQLNKNERELVEIAPEVLLAGPYPTLFDEWQEAPNIWNQVRHAIDQGQAKGRFLLTGSAMPEFDKTRHPGSGRLARLRLRTFTLQESGDSDASVSIRSLTEGKGQSSKSELKAPGISEVIDAILRGGFPDHLSMDPATAQRAVKTYIQQVPLIEAPLMLGIRKSPKVMFQLLKTLARQLGSDLVFSRIKRDLDASGVIVDETTIPDYVDLLERMFLIERVPAWFGHLRSKVRLSQTDKYYFADPSLPAALLDADKTALYADLETTGFLFENLVFRELVVISDLIDANVFHYRDKSNLEVDFILRLADGRIVPIEVKLGTNRVKEAIETLARFEKKLDPELNRIAFKAVITTGEYSYPDKDSNTWVISVHHLGV